MDFSARNCCSHVGNLRKISLDGDKMESRVYRRTPTFSCSWEEEICGYFQLWRLNALDEAALLFSQVLYNRPAFV
jgi:hypothetical protein